MNGGIHQREVMGDRVGQVNDRTSRVVGVGDRSLQRSESERNELQDVTKV